MRNCITLALLGLTQPIQSIYTKFPEEHDPSHLVRDGDYIMSYFSGVELSVIEPNGTQWKTELFADGLQFEEDENTWL